MTKKLFRYSCLAIIIVFVACLVLIVGGMYGYFVDSQHQQLAAQSALAAQGVNEAGAAYFEGLDSGEQRLTWVDAAGNVLYDNKADAAAMENHADREEIAAALSSGYGESSRYSSTLMEKEYYAAQRLHDGSVIRVASAQYSVVAYLLLISQPLIIVLLIAIALSLLLASKLSRQIVKPLNELDLDQPLANDAYEELAPLLIRIERQHREIEQHAAQLQRQQDEFSAVTGSMNEGLVLLNQQGIILSINNSAQRLLGADGSCVGRHMLTLNRSMAVQEVLEQAQAGQRAEKLIPLAGGEYQLDASPVWNNDQVSGVALLLFDVTEKYSAEQMRREFTANVSHELKTPLHSISGCAELLEQGLVKPEDQQRFAKQIHDEARRMIQLVDDIIRLSRLDEGAEELLRQPLAFDELIAAVAAQLAPYAAEQSVTIQTQLQPLSIIGVKALLSELVYNLCDNAIKYNRPGGSVIVSLSQEAAGVVLKVSDTGIGVPEQHQSRIFERFYRVDKSHSKQSGGTGLGLSIVKHAAQLHQAEISVNSAVDRGTTVSVTFPAPPHPAAPSSGAKSDG